MSDIIAKYVEEYSELTTCGRSNFSQILTDFVKEITSALEAENAKLKAEKAELFEKFDKLEATKDVNQLAFMLAYEVDKHDEESVIKVFANRIQSYINTYLGWQSVKPASGDYFEGEYAIKFKQDGHNREMFGHQLFLNYLFIEEEETGIKKDIKYLKLPPVEEEHDKQL
jgi:hypothetical protein